MRIHTAEYVVTAVKPDQYPVHDMPEVAVVGRSNVGKSSLINRMSQRKKLARTSGTPGKTRTINFFLMNGEFFLVDLPGYGFARVSRDVKKEWAGMINTYLSRRPQLLTTLLLVDIRHKPTGEDLEMYQWLCRVQNRVIVACTKSDKISRGRWPAHMKIIRETLNLRPEDQMVPCSSESPEGVEEILKVLGEVVYGPERENEES